MQHPRWREGRLSTGFIAEEFPDGFQPLVAKGETERRLAVVAAHIDHVLNERKRRISGQLREPEQLRFELKRIVAMGRSRVELEIDAKKSGVAIVVRRRPQGRGPFGLEAGRSPVARNRRRRRDRRAGAPDPQRLCALACGRRRRRARLHPPRGPARRADDRAQGRRRLEDAALPDARPRQGDRGQGRAGGEGGRAALHRRGDEDGERAERRARRDGQGDSVQGRRFAARSTR